MLNQAESRTAGMEVATGRRRMQGLGEGLNSGEGSKRQVKALFNL